MNPLPEATVGRSQPCYTIYDVHGHSVADSEPPIVGQLLKLKSFDGAALSNATIKFCSAIKCRPAEVRPGEDRPAEVRPDEDRPAEVRLDEARLAEVSHAEVHPAEVLPA